MTGPLEVRSTVRGWVSARFVDSFAEMCVIGTDGPDVAPAAERGLPKASIRNAADLAPRRTDAVRAAFSNPRASASVAGG